MAVLKRVLLALGLLLGALVYVWAAAVRALPRVRKRKAELRRHRYGPTRRPGPDRGAATVPLRPAGRWHLLSAA